MRMMTLLMTLFPSRKGRTPTGGLPVTGKAGYLNLNSPKFDAIRHDPIQDHFYVRYRSGKEVVYSGIPVKTLEEFVRSGCLVSYFEERIRRQYTYKVLTRGRESAGHPARGHSFAGCVQPPKRVSRIA